MVAQHPWEIADKLLRGVDELWEPGTEPGREQEPEPEQAQEQEQEQRLGAPGEEVMRDLTWHLCKES